MTEYGGSVLRKTQENAIGERAPGDRFGAVRLAAGVGTERKGGPLMVSTSLTRVVGANIRRLMRAQGLTNYELAERAGVGRRTLTNLQSSDWPGSPRLDTLESIARVLRVKTWELCVPERELRERDNGQAIVDHEALARIIEALDVALQRQKRPLTPADRAEYAAYLYAEYLDAGELPSEGKITRLVALTR
jgi:transcriptional regulator with XRE-family HTH domain